MKITLASSFTIMNVQPVATQVMKIMKQAMQGSVRQVELEWSLPAEVKVTTVPQQVPAIFSGDKLILYAILKGAVSIYSNLAEYQGLCVVDNSPHTHAHTHTHHTHIHFSQTSTSDHTRRALTSPQHTQQAPHHIHVRTHAHTHTHTHTRTHSAANAGTRTCTPNKLTHRSTHTHCIQGEGDLAGSVTLKGRIGDRELRFDLPLSREEGPRAAGEGSREEGEALPLHRLAAKAQIKLLEDRETAREYHEKGACCVVCAW